MCYILTGHSQIDHSNFTYEFGAIVRGDSTQKKLSLVFTGDLYVDGAAHIIKVLEEQHINGAFFFTGNLYRNQDFESKIKSLVQKGHYLGAHSNEHLLYCDWKKRDSLLVSQKEFISDLQDNYKEMQRHGIDKKDAPYFLPPYEWYNDTIAKWTNETDLQLINMTHGTYSQADYTTPQMTNYKDSKTIYNNILHFEDTEPNGLNGFMLLIHIGTDPDRKDKFYIHLETLIKTLKNKGYKFITIKNLLGKS